MERYLEDIHVQKNIGCVDCHALVIPPETNPDDGIVPTGHSFDITPATCVACHTDALHAGFSLPGYENGANISQGDKQSSSEDTEIGAIEPEIPIEEQSSLTPEQRIEALETALASRSMTTIFQGSVIGIVLGGSTAWIIARNIRNVPEEEVTEEDNEDGEETED